MNFDLRLPIGLMFGLLGVLLLAFGLLSDPEIYRRSLGINVNLIWGAVLIVFGAAMLWFSHRARRQRNS
jgi:multisubunit Na+/H+ antiporter MnhG subunit